MSVSHFYCHHCDDSWKECKRDDWDAAWFCLTCREVILCDECGETWRDDHECAEMHFEYYQELINSGQAWTLEGAVGREAMALIEAGQCILGPQGHYDYWGNYVPSRYEVEPGTKGSLAYQTKVLCDG